MNLSFYRWRDNDYYLADLVTTVDGEQHVLGTYKLIKTPELALKWHIAFTEYGDDAQEQIIGGGWTLAEVKKGASADAARRAYRQQFDFHRDAYRFFIGLSFLGWVGG